MELKPGYKQTEVGVIPEEWEVVPFSDLLDFRNGANADKGAYGKGTPFINVLEVITHSHICAADIPGRVSLSKDTADSYSVRRGDLVFNRTSETQEEVGLAAVYLDDEAVVFGGFVIRGRQRTGSLDGGYSGYAFRAPLVRSQIIAKGQGAIRANIGQADLRQILASRPPLPEQRAIAAALGDVDALLGALTQLIAKKRDLKQATMQQLLTGQTRLPGFRGEWEMRRFGEIAWPRAERIDPQRTGVQDFCVELEHIERESGQLLGSAVTDEHSSLKSVFRSGDVLFGKLRAYLRKYWLADRDGVCSTEVWALVAQRPVVTPEFLLQMVQVEDFLAAASTVYGTHMPRSDWSIVRNYEAPLPSVPEQTAIAAVLSDMGAEVAVLGHRLAKTRDLKQGMMQELLTGRTRLV